MPFGIKEDQDAEKHHKPEEIVAKLRQVDVLVSQGQNIVDASHLNRHDAKVGDPTARWQRRTDVWRGPTNPIGAWLLQKRRRQRGVHSSGTGPTGEPRCGVSLPVLSQPLEQGATVHIRKTRYGSISLVFVELISDEHPELLDDAPAPPPQDAAV
jgi:hypothetical protein